MIRRVLPLSLFLCVGCLGDGSGPQLVEGNPFKAPGIEQRQVEVPRDTPQARATEEVALRVSQLGRKILDANPEIGLHPRFTTVGAPHLEIFHRSTREVWITEGLVRACKTEGQLAAVLCLELGKMVSEREALAQPRTRQPTLEPPPEVPVGNDSGGRFGAADGTRLLELARYDRPRRKKGFVPPPSPEVLAERYLVGVGHDAKELESIKTIARQASRNSTLEKMTR
jgi:hypothetical protein